MKQSAVDVDPATKEFPCPTTPQCSAQQHRTLTRFADAGGPTCAVVRPKICWPHIEMADGADACPDRQTIPALFGSGVQDPEPDTFE